ncbi:MAG: DUF4416 family protein [Planctomycetota bacterium]
MGEINLPRPVLLVTAVSSRYDECFDWTKGQLQQAWGKVQFESPRFEFSETKFYRQEMGVDLKKQLLAFEALVDPVSLAQRKIFSNQLEERLKSDREYPESRPLNIDPGYMTEAKLVLATTKNRDHRIYLQQGIYAEITLFYQGKKWNSSRWTYPDYCRHDFQEFFDLCRNWLRERYQQLRAESEMI